MNRYPLLRAGGVMPLLLSLLPHLAFSWAAPDDSAGLAPLQVGGYVKYLYSSVESPGSGRVDDQLLHARVNGKLFLTDALRLAAEIRNRVYVGGIVRNTSDFLSSIRADHDGPRGDIVWWSSTSSVGYSELDRLWLDARWEKFQVSVGRQRIAWGTALVWNPTDVFNPLSVLDFDYEERPGVDAVHLQYFTGDVTKLEAVVKPGRTRARRVFAGKVLLNQWEYDIHLLGGVQGISPFAGVSWAGDIAGAGFRGEVMSKKVSDEAAGILHLPTRSWSTSVALSGDYTFPSNTYLHTEILYNDRGVTDDAAEDRPGALALGLLSPGRWSLFQELSFDLHPLLRVSGFVICNPSDGSTVWVPSAAWSVVQNIDLSLIGLFFAGRPLTEFGTFGQSFFLRAKYSF